MQLPLHLFLALPLLSLTSAKVLGPWTIQALTRSCTPDGTACTYSPTLDADYHHRTRHSTTGRHDADSTTQTCSFTVAQSPTATRSSSSFTAVPWGDRLRVDVQWQQDGAVTLVVTDFVGVAYTVFGFRDDELVRGTVAGLRRRVRAYWVGTLADLEDSEGKDGWGLETREREEKEQRTWQVLGLLRFPDIDLNATNVRFAIADSDGGHAYCALVVRGTNPRASWYGQRCESGFTVSWGYNNASDSAVMTVCYPANGTSTWFGFERVSSGVYLGDSKKERVYRTGCA